MRKHIIFCGLVVLAIGIQQVSSAQQSLSEKQGTNTKLGISGQLYPAGIILTLNAEFQKDAKSSLVIRGGGNFADRKDFSPYNENEKGNGIGGSIGYHRYYALWKGNFVAGINSDIWNMWIYWKNKIGKPDQFQGRTYTLVLQPWIEAGYYHPIKSTPLQVGVMLAFGREINVITDGKGVGQGWMRSMLISFQYSLKQRK